MRYFVLLWALLALPARAQVLILGRVVDEKGQPVAYASVALADGRAGTATNEVGEFSLRVPPLPRLLTVLSIGYERAEAPAAQPGRLPTDVVLKASAVALPEVTVRANAEAEELVRRCYAKLLRHQADVQYGRGFYRQKTRENGRYREFFDAFYDVKITPRNMPSWALGEASYALTPGGMTMTNFSSLTRLVSLFQTGPVAPDKLLVPPRSDASEHFSFVLRQTLREQGRELAVVDFLPRPGETLAPKGTLYLDPRTATVARIEQELPAEVMTLSNPAFHVEKITQRLTTDFVAQNDSLTRIANTRNVTVINATANGFADETVVTSYFLIYEYGAPTPGQQYRDTGLAVNDLAEIRKRRYHPAFWRDNAVLKDSPVEAQVIEDFEGRRVFGKL